MTEAEEAEVVKGAACQKRLTEPSDPAADHFPHLSDERDYSMAAVEIRGTAERR